MKKKTTRPFRTPPKHVAPIAKANLTLIGGGTEEEREKTATKRRPTVFELAQIAAVLNGTKEWNQFCPDYLFNQGEKPSLTDAAVGLWERCGESLRSKIRWDNYQELQDEIYEDSMNQGIDSLHRSFPIEFDVGLKVVMGEKIRRDAAHRAFRHFLYSLYRTKVENYADDEAKADNQFAEIKAKGFEENKFEKFYLLFPKWKAAQAKEKAGKAAAKRWEKHNKEKKHLATIKPTQNAI